MRIRQPQDPGGPPEALIMEIGKLPMRSVLEDMSTWSKLTQVFSQSANEDIFVVGEQDKERIREAISSLPRRMPGQTSKASEFGNGDHIYHIQKKMKIHMLAVTSRCLTYQKPQWALLYHLCLMTLHCI